MISVDIHKCFFGHFEEFKANSGKKIGKNKEKIGKKNRQKLCFFRI